MTSIAERMKNMLLKPPLPENLSKEHIGVWDGWCSKGNREVCREGAAKGLRNLAVTFLTRRTKLDYSEVDEFFTKEVLVWVDELLDRKQIFRVSHILNNVGLDPSVQLEHIFYKTTKKDLREYIGNHLESVNKLNDKLKQLWHLLELVLRNSILTMKQRLHEESIECLDRQDDDWKFEISGKLFLRTYELKLLPFLKPDILWKLLLGYNDTKLLKCWINISYSERSEENFGIPENLQMIFQKFPVTNEYTNIVLISNASSITQHAILNEFSKFGVFNNHDVNDCVSVLRRFAQSENISNLFQIMKSSSSNLSQDTYFHLFIEFCLQNDLWNVLNCCMQHVDVSHLTSQKRSPYLELILNFHNMEFTESTLLSNIFSVAKFLTDDLEHFFVQHPLIFIALLLLSNEVKFLTPMENQTVTIYGKEFFDTFSNIMSNFDFINIVYYKRIHSLVTSISYYELLEKHLGIDVKSLFSVGSSMELLHFSSPLLDTDYKYSKKINYLFYLKQARPSIACKKFILESLNRNSWMNDDYLKITHKKVFKRAFLDFSNAELITSCIALLEMIGIDSKFLRTSLKVACILLDAEFEYSYIKSLFLNIENEVYTIQNHLEEVLKSTNITPPLTGEELVTLIKLYNIAITFSTLNNINLPDSLLNMFATQNLWFEFMLFAQIRNYPIEQIKAALQSFKNPNLLDHVSHCVTHDIQVDEQNTLMRERDSRKYFLSRIGLRQSLESVNQNIDSPYSSMKSASSVSVGSSNGSSGSEFLEIDTLNVKATLLQTLIRCHNSSDPPRALLQACQLYRNPLLAVLATSYEPDSIITNWITWVAVCSKSYQRFTNFESITTSAQSVALLLNNCMVNSFPKTLFHSFQIFLPVNPMKVFVEFLINLIEGSSDLPSLRAYLMMFEDGLKNLRRRSVLSETDHDLTYLRNKIWVESTCLMLLSSAIEHNCNSVYEQIQFLEVICKLKLEIFFSVTCPNFNHLLEILKNIHESQCEIRFEVCAFFDEKCRKDAVVKCINKLLEKEYFKTALNVGNVINLPVDVILIKQWQKLFENRSVPDKNFWTKCDEDFVTHKVSIDTIIEFYLDCIDKVEDNYERYILLQLAWDWSRKFRLSNQYQLERKKWISYVNLEPKWKEINQEVINFQPPNMTYKDMLDTLKDMPEYEEDLPSTCKSQLEKIQIEALSVCNFWLALKLEKLFNCKSTDMDVLKLCYSLAEGILLPYQLNIQQRLLLSKGKHYRRFSQRRSFLSAKYTLSGASHSPASSSNLQTEELDSEPDQDVAALLYALTEKVTNGAEIAYTIFMTYRISINIEIPYHVVVSNSDHMKMLKDALEDDCMNKLEVIHDFFKIYKWTNGEIADFICEEIINAASKYVQCKAETLLMWDLNLGQELHLVIQLLQDNCSLLGHKIYAYASALHKMQLSADLDFKISELALIDELLIIAHECFTADCNMEGISIILKKCQVVISHLLTLRSWKLIVRLLTGVGRYTEMNYVFQILRENDQFEFLLRKGSRKDNALKGALLEYLKKYCPDNKELYKIVALHFTLFSEVALLWEREAQSVIRNLIAISKLEMQNNKLNPDSEQFVQFSNTDGTNLCLNKAIENYTHATEFHLQGEKLAKAMNAAKQAELLALQISLLRNTPLNGSTVCVLNLNIPQIATLISKQLSFHQSQILVQAYNYQADWAHVLFEQVIVRNNSVYLEAFLQNLPLMDSLVRDISRKFISANINTPDEIKAMKQILVNLPSVHTKYRIASELGFTDVVEDLIVSGQLAYLKDTVWKKGYKKLD